MTIHTGYSFRAAVGHLQDVINRLKAIGWQVAPIADRCSTFAFVRWTKLAKAADLRPIYGVELAVTNDPSVKKPSVDHWTFLAKDDVTALHELINTATEHDGKDAMLTYAQAHAAQGVFKVSGHRVLLEHVKAGDPDYYFGVTPATPTGLLRMAQAQNLRLVAASANAYPEQKDRELYRLALGYTMRKGQAQPRAETQSYPQHILSDEEWHAAMEPKLPAAARTAAIAMRERLFAASTATLKKATLLQPKKQKTLRKMCEEGAAALGCDLTDPVYADRLERELSMIKEKNFEDYFYIVADIVQWARKHMIVGPARGSSAGSLACYLLGITAVDPIPYGLLFERFVDVTRSDLPDIDIDFSDANRDKVFEYVKQKYGEDRVARLGTVSMLGPRSIFKMLGPALRLPQWQINKVLDSLILRSSGDTRANQQIEDTLMDTDAGRELAANFPEVLIAGRMENHPSVASQHAAGIVMTQKPVREYVAVDARTNSAMCDKKDAAELNLLKIDALGLTQLSIFERTLELIGKRAVSAEQFLERLPLDDRAAFNVLNNGHFAGVFQFMGVTLQALVRQINVKSLNDIVAITALSRPGPMATGGASTWARRRAGLEPVSYPHPILQPYLEETLGVVTFQEQVMKIGRELGDLSWKDVTALRKAMSQSLGQEYFDQFGVRWKAGAIQRGIPQELVDKIWFDLCAFGSWGFNKSHAVSYALVSYWCCWLKAHHPLEFAAASLDAAEGDPARQIMLLREMRDEGIDYVPVDPQHSTARWVPVVRDGKRLLVGPLTNIKGIGPKAVHEITSCRARGEPIRAALQKKLAAAKTEIDSLFPIRDRIHAIHGEGATRMPPLPIKDVQVGKRGDVVIYGVLRKLNLRDENEDVNVAKRGGRRVSGPETSLLMFFRDDTDEIFCKVNRYDYERIGRQIMERGRTGKALYAIKGEVPKDFRMIRVKDIKYLGDLETSMAPERGGQTQDRSQDSNTGIDQGVRMEAAE